MSPLLILMVTLCHRYYFSSNRYVTVTQESINFYHAFLIFRFMPSDMAWAFALYLESVASLPQLFMFQKEKEVMKWT